MRLQFMSVLLSSISATLLKNAHRVGDVHPLEAPVQKKYSQHATQSLAIPTFMEKEHATALFYPN